MDFYQIAEKRGKDSITIYPDFKPCRSKDLMIRGRSFYAIWDEARQIWSTDECDVQRLIDQDLEQYADNLRKSWNGVVVINRMISYSSQSWSNYRRFMRDMFDNFHQLDEDVTFANQNPAKKEYVSKKLGYSLEPGSFAAYDELVSTLYEPSEKQKLEWAIGSIVAGEAKHIQKFIVLYGEAGSGKSTFLNIVEKLFSGYTVMFDAKALTSSNNGFATESFRSNPLVAIQHDADLSRIEDNTKLNSIVSHENMEMNEKYKASYISKSNAFLFMGSNKAVKITDGKSGLLRRLIDVIPSGKKVETERYHTLLSQINFELGAIAYHCHEVFQQLGKNYYASYRPIDMLFQTNIFFNFVEDNLFAFRDADNVTLKQAYDIYKAYCDETSVDFKMQRHVFREELKGYFRQFEYVGRVDGKQVRNLYSGFRSELFENGKVEEEKRTTPMALTIDEEKSRLDDILADCPAQYATENQTPEFKWDSVTTTLKDLDTTRLHFVRPPENHIVIDFDLKDENGNKSFEKNLEAANKWPPTYAEFSKSKAGIHLHYIYEGDVNRLNRVFGEDIEIKVFTGKSSLRRKLSLCNNSPIVTLTSGLPLKGDKMIDFEAVKSEQHLRAVIEKNLRKEVHPGTKPSIDFIDKILDDAYKSGMKYDVTDMRPRILAFANNSTNQSEYCVKLVNKMHFSSEEPSETPQQYQSDELIFFDVEVFPNLFVVVWKSESKQPVVMINPGPKDIEDLIKFKLVGFNNRRYDNHILYARYIGYNNERLYDLSQRLVNNSRNGLFGEAYNLSYTDIYDFSSKKQSLKKFEIELGIHHQELGLPWDQPVPEELWPKVAEYCCNDVIATQAVFEARHEDFIARLILSDLSGLTPNDTTQQHTARIIFGTDKTPQEKFVYTDLSEEFPGYKFEMGKSTYRGEVTGEGGYVYAEPGMYSNVAVLDIASMHPHSAIWLNIFGPYTKNFKELVDARIAIKHKDYDQAKSMLGGILSNYLTNDGDSGALAYALKIVINIVYGLTSAKFDNKFKDPRNKDNIVAKRGALFMIDLKHAVQDKGFTVAHIKTDSIKIPNATPEIIQFVQELGKKYGYTFEHESTYSRMCLVNDAVYIARYSSKEECEAMYGYLPSDNKKHPGEWSATGAQFAQPYVFKSLFSKEPIVFNDLCETKSVTSALYLDFNERLGEDEHNYRFVGKTGAFCPMEQGTNAGLLVREKDGKYYAATGSKGYRWMESEVVKELGLENRIERQYYDALCEEAVLDISKYGDMAWFLSDSTTPLSTENDPIGFDETPPYCERGEDDHKACAQCQYFYTDENFGPSCKLENDLPF